MRSGTKIDLFYGAVAIVLLAGVLATLFNQERSPAVPWVGDASTQSVEPKKQLPQDVDANTVDEPSRGAK